MIDDVLGNVLSWLYDFLLVCGDDFGSPAEYCKHFNNRFEVLKQSGFRVASAALRDNVMAEMVTRGHEDTNLYTELDI